ncbi:MAG: DUF3307 domain-containing protein, partial [Amphiplicatus sp.]
ALQTAWMVNGKAQPWPKFLYPLSVHVLTHALMTLAIVCFVDVRLWYLALVDFAVHFAMDRIKSNPALFGRFNDPQKASFWIPMGFDQMIHHFTHYFIIWRLYAERFL